MSLEEWALLSTFVFIVGLALVFKLRKLFNREDRGFQKSIVWSKDNLPITLIIDDNLIKTLPEIVAVTENAISFWNDSIDLDLFVPLGDLVEDGTTIPVMSFADDATQTADSKHGDSALAITRITASATGDILSAAVYVNVEYIEKLKEHSNLDSDDIVWGMAHELGHCLGLDHDDFTSSVMYKRITKRDPEVTDKDKNLLLKFYE